MRRSGAPTYSRRFVGNTDKKEVHDLDNEKTGPHECQIDEIIQAGHVKLFFPDELFFYEFGCKAVKNSWK